MKGAREVERKLPIRIDMSVEQRRQRPKIFGRKPTHPRAQSCIQRGARRGREGPGQLKPEAHTLLFVLSVFAIVPLRGS